MRDIIKPGLILFLITCVASICLGFVYDITKEPIEKQRAETKATALKEILSQADEFKEIKDMAEPITELYEGLSSGNLVGYIIGVSPKGYADSIDLLVGIDTNGDIIGINIVRMNETPGLGTEANKPKFKEQFAGKSDELIVTKNPPKAENEIEAITGATITSKAITDGVNNALKLYNESLAK